MTNAISYLSQMDMIVVLKNGEISELGTYEDLLKNNGAFAEFIATYLKEMDEDEANDVDGKIIVPF